MSASSTEVLRDVGSGWLECQDVHGIFYYNTMTKRSSFAPQLDCKVDGPHWMEDASSTSSLQSLQAATTQPHSGVPMMSRVFPTEASTLQLMQEATARPRDLPTALGVKVVREIGDVWLQCEDVCGAFYFNRLTRQASMDLPAEAPPPALAPCMPEGSGRTQPGVRQRPPELPRHMQGCAGQWMALDADVEAEHLEQQQAWLQQQYQHHTRQRQRHQHLQFQEQQQQQQRQHPLGVIRGVVRLGSSGGG
uniref:WW domain-containing protein n=1 Tax=Alexandrium monilatum TaxID=311494 RepID=A0A7S4T058_9DINO